MAGFFQWVGHRKELVGFTSWVAFCRAAGIHRASIESLRAGGAPRLILAEADLQRLSYLLHASYKRVRWLADGRIQWIDDKHWLPLEHSPGRRALPVDDPKRTAAVGRIIPSGDIEVEPDWNPEFGPWIPCRVATGRRTFALRLMPFDPDHDVQRWIIFRLVRRDWIPDQQDVAIFLSNGIESRGVFGRLNVVGETILLHLQDANRTTLEIPRWQIVQLARVVGHFTPPP